MTAIFKYGMCYCIIPLCILLQTIQEGNAAEYTSIGNGEWSDVSIWSTDGGITSCSCAPQYSFETDSVYLYDTVTFTSDITLNDNAAYLHVFSGGQLLGSSNDITVSDGLLIADSNTLVESLDLTVSNTGTMNVDEEVTVISKMTIHGLLNLTGKITVQGDKGNIMSTATANITGGEIIVENNDLIISGIVNLNYGCLVTNTGTIKNQASGFVNGTGASSSGIDIDNSGSWSSNVQWCAAGTGSGMPTAEDCSFDCAAIILLPIELQDFKACQQGDIVLIEWTTSVEINNNYFSIERSTDGLNYEEICRQKGAGNSNSIINYECHDQDPVSISAYYRVKQFDFDGKSTTSQIVALNFQTTNSLNAKILADRVIITGWENTSSKDIMISLFDVFGKQIAQNHRSNGPINTVELFLNGRSNLQEMVIVKLTDFENSSSNTYRILIGEKNIGANFRLTN